MMSVLSIITAILLVIWILKRPRGSHDVSELSRKIYEGAMAFLNKEYTAISVFVVVVASILAFLAITGYMSMATPFSFLFGAFLSALAGNVGMRVATTSNCRTVWAVKKDIHSGLRVAFSSGAVMGLTVVGLGLFGLSLLYLIFGDPSLLFGFGFGASSIALFARVGGGIYTKSADMGADLVGKIEAGIPEDDPRNPAVIADNVGDNVGDVAGMGSDLFESYVDSIISAMALGVLFSATMGGLGIESVYVQLPLILAGMGIISSIIGILAVIFIKSHDPATGMDRGIYISAMSMLILSYIVIYMFGVEEGIFYSLASGLIAGVVIGLSTEYFTSYEYSPTRKIARSAVTSPAVVIISGLSTGMFSTLIPILAVALSIICAYASAHLYGIAIAAVGMLSTLGMSLASDTYGPVADNAAGIAEMAGLGRVVRERAEMLDAVGNTTAAIGKGLAIGSAALTALALFVTYSSMVHIKLSLAEPETVAGLLIGASMPFIFSSLTMAAVGRAAMKMVEEVRRQFREIPGLLEGKAEPDTKKCVEISTVAGIKEMIVPGALAVIVPIVVGLFSTKILGGLLAGATVSGFLLAVLMANAGGAWDNAKKYIERGHFGGKGSTSHKSAVVGDTVGDPLKDTSGPSLNILIKLMSIVAIVFLPIFL